MNNYIISASELKALLDKKNKNICLIDVRSIQEHQNFNIGGEVIPLSELPKRMNELDKEKTIIFYCHAGVRSLMAVKVLMDAGFPSVKSLEGGMLAWQNQEVIS